MSDKPTYKYNDSYIDNTSISINQELGFRYSLIVPIKNPVNEKHVLVIMRNPSEANKEKSDKTINNVLNFCHDKYSKVYFANLYPYYETDSTKVKDFIESGSYEEKMQKNFKVIQELLVDIDEVIIAWGTNNTGKKYDEDYNNIVDKLLKLLEKGNKKIYAMRFESTKNPWHPRNWEAGFKLELYPWKK